MVQLLTTVNSAKRRKDFRGTDDSEITLLTKWKERSPDRTQPAVSARSNKDKLVGEWLAALKAGPVGSYTFGSDQTAVITIGDTVQDGASYGLGYEMIWELDETQDPMHLDIVVTREGREIARRPGIARFATDDTLQLLRSLPDEGRPTAFVGAPHAALAEEEFMLLLTRKGSGDAEVYHGRDD